MKRALILVLSLAACQEEAVQNVDPIALTPETLGYFCQMNLLEHEGPKGQVHLEGLPGAPLFFSQVTDLVTYLRLPEQSNTVLAIYVSDMGAEGATWDQPGAANWTDATTASYVVGANVTGGMGAPELAPFADPDKARAFAALHGGSVMALEAIPDSALAPLTPDLTGGDEDYSDRLKSLSIGG
jgi:copper chaperone NosL